jgi:putative flippase GtrA
MIERLARNAPPWSHEVLRFLVVGGSAFLVDAGILSLMARLGLPPLAARAVSISVALVFTWQMHRRLTFKVATPATFREFRRYVAISLVSIVMNYAVFSVMQTVMPPIAAAAVGTIVAAVYNFFRYRALMGRKQPMAAE